MDRPFNIKPTEAKQMLRLANRLHVTHDPVARKKQLLQGLCALVRAPRGSCIVRHQDPDSRRHIPLSVTHFPDDAATSPAEPSIQGELSVAGAGNGVGDATALVSAKAQTLQTTLNLTGSTVSVTLQFHRDSHKLAPFSARARQLVNLFHVEMIWIYQTDVVLSSANALALAPRARQTLELLLAGLGEKQIASKLCLSPNTVHHYVKSIHRHFGVSSRSELLARWVGK